MATGFDAGFHALKSFAILGAGPADVGALRAEDLLMLRTREHEMRCRAAYFSAGHHQAKMRGPKMIAALFQAVGHGGAEAGLITAKTGVNADLAGIVHGVPLS
jgi:hypothetical protein